MGPYLFIYKTIFKIYNGFRFKILPQQNKFHFFICSTKIKTLNNIH